MSSTCPATGYDSREPIGKRTERHLTTLAIRGFGLATVSFCDVEAWAPFMESLWRFLDARKELQSANL
jgi:hypothetical protein